MFCCKSIASSETVLCEMWAKYHIKKSDFAVATYLHVLQGEAKALTKKIATNDKRTLPDIFIHCKEIIL